MPVRVGTIAVLLGIALNACASPAEPNDGNDSAGGPVTLEEGRTRVVGLVDETVSALGADISPSEGRLGTPVACEQDGAPADTRSASYTVELAWDESNTTHELLDQTRSFWEQEGYDVTDENIDTDFPVLYGSKDGFTLALLVSRERREARLAGDTPCLPDEQ